MSRCAELNRREVDEKAEHLRLLSWLTGLITSFTMTNPVEFNYDVTVSTVHDLPLVRQQIAAMFCHLTNL